MPRVANPFVEELPPILVEEVAGAPAGLFAARVRFEDGSKHLVLIPRSAVFGRVVELSFQAAATIYGSVGATPGGAAG